MYLKNVSTFTFLQKQQQITNKALILKTHKAPKNK